MKRVTLDTNVLVSATFWTGESFKIVDMIDKKKVHCILSDEILSEYNQVISSEEIMEKAAVKNLIVLKSVQKIISDSQIVFPKERLDAVKDDKEDNKIIECAKAGKADYIITNDHHLLKLKEYECIKIIAPKDFLEEIDYK